MVGLGNDEELMLAYGGGDVEAFEVIYRRHSGRLYRYLLRQCGNPDDAQELFQDVWANLIRARERYEVRARFATYLFTLAHNRLVDHYRRQGHNPIAMAANPGAGDDHANLEDIPDLSQHVIEDGVHRRRVADRLLELIDRLPSAQREAFLLREEAGLSVDEIADVTGVNPETAKSRLRYAVAKLRRLLQDEFGT
ncbi:MAG: sigma-70 family RNA polymerase sigma factor [Acidiferrobacterales bacterium]